ncbi:hypothetical protein BD560DRAFT_425692 [Blakeslea trispora]|nr:hypothetical protein BD560DRAFT_425692 [Blakeslea trispora]
MCLTLKYDTKGFWLSRINFKVYIKKQKGTREIAKSLLHGCKTYGNDSTVSFSQTKLLLLMKMQHLVLLYEYLTNLVCNKCQTRTLENVVDRNTLRKVHMILKCKSCSTVWNCDVYATKNICYVFTYQANR